MITTTGRRSSKPALRATALAALAALAVALAALLAGSCRVRVEPERRSDLRAKVVALARSLVGLPYRYGGADIDGFDCSGLVHYVYSCFGIELPRSAQEQARLRRGRKSLAQAKAGDILLFKFGRRWHAALYVGEGRFVHAPNERSPVREERWSATWGERLKAIRAVLD